MASIKNHQDFADFIEMLSAIKAENRSLNDAERKLSKIIEYAVYYPDHLLEVVKAAKPDLYDAFMARKAEEGHD